MAPQYGLLIGIYIFRINWSSESFRKLQEERGKKGGAISDPACSLTTEYRFLFLRVTPIKTAEQPGEEFNDL